MTTKTVLVIQTNAVPGRDDEFNDWYDHTHLPEVLRLPGVVAAQRFAFDRPRDEGAAAPEYRYLALYEIEGDPAVTLAALDAAIADGMFLSPAMERMRFAHVFRPITERIVSSD